MGPFIIVTAADLLPYPELISQVQALSSKWEEAGEHLRFKVAPGKLMQLIGLLNLQHVSYKVEFPARS